MTGGIGGGPTVPIYNCGEEPPPPEPEWLVIQNESCRVDVLDLNSAYDMTALDSITITTNGPNSPMTFTAPFAYPIQLAANSIAVAHEDLCDVTITAIELDTDGDITVVPGADWETSQYVASVDGSSPCTITITADNPGSLGEIGSVQFDVNGGGTEQFIQPFTPGDGTAIVIADPAFCAQTIDEVRLYIGVGTFLIQTIPGPIVVPA